MNFLRGSSFDFSGPVVLLDQGQRVLDLTGWVVTSQIRTLSADLVADLDVEWLDATQSLLRVSCAASTAAWPVGAVSMDFRFVSPAGQIVFSQPSSFKVQKVITV